MATKLYVLDTLTNLVVHESTSLRQCEEYVGNVHYIWGHKLSRYEICNGVADLAWKQTIADSERLGSSEWSLRTIDD